MTKIDELYQKFGQAVRQTEIWKNAMDVLRGEIQKEELKQNNASNPTPDGETVDK